MSRCHSKNRTSVSTGSGPLKKSVQENEATVAVTEKPQQSVTRFCGKDKMRNIAFLRHWKIIRREKQTEI